MISFKSTDYSAPDALTTDLVFPKAMSEISCETLSSADTTVNKRLPLILSKKSKKINKNKPINKQKILLPLNEDFLEKVSKASLQIPRASYEKI